MDVLTGNSKDFECRGGDGTNCSVRVGENWARVFTQKRIFSCVENQSDAQVVKMGKAKISKNA